MSIFFSNPPWWEGKESRPGWKKWFRSKRWRRGVRAGSRWPLTMVNKSRPNKRHPKDYTPYPYFLGYAATYARDKIGKENVFFRDSIGISESYKSYFNFLETIKNKIEYLLIETATPSWKHDYKLIKEIKEKYSHIKIIIAGPISSEPEKFKNFKEVYAALKGEYEKNTMKVLNGEKGVIEHDLLTLEEMNKSPFPYFDDLNYDNYFDGNPAPMGVYFPQAHIWSSRGCPFKCIFCVWPASMTGNDLEGNKTRTVRQYSKSYMRNLIGDLLDRYKFKTIYFDDDTFNMGNRHTTDMCEIMNEFKIPWFAMCRADTIRKETWKIMSESGCKGVKIGVESGSQYVVDKIVNKHLDLNYTKKIVQYIKSLGMNVHGTFTYGLPGETKKNMLETKKYISDVGFTTIQESGTAEIEGAPLHSLNKKNLKVYPAAKIGKGYQRHTDGNKKWMDLVEDLQNQ